MKKENKLFKFTAFVLLITIIAVILVSGTYSKYASTASGTSATVVAKWSFNVNGSNIASEEFTFNLFDTANIKDSDGSAEEDVAAGLIAPGTSGAFEFALENTSDVTAQYDITLTAVNEKNIPIEYSFDGQNWETDLTKLVATDVMAIGGTKNVTVQWRWAFDGDTDVALGGQQVTVTASITATQVDNSELENTTNENLVSGTYYMYDYTAVPTITHVFSDGNGNDGNRVATLVPVRFDMDVTITAKTGFLIGVWGADDDRTQLTDKWTSSVTLPANESWYILIRNDDNNTNTSIILEGKEMLITEWVDGLPAANKEMSVSENVWENKSIVFVGDSITADTSDGAWYKQLATKLGVSNYTTKAIGAASVSSTVVTERTHLVDWYTDIPQADVIVIMMGTNDWGNDSTIGTVYDQEDVSFQGAWNVVINGLKSKYPNSEIVLVTPMERIVYKTGTVAVGAQNDIGYTLEYYAKQIKAIAAKHNCAVVDANAYAGVDPTSTEQFKDGLHPTAEGNRIMIENIWKQFMFLAEYYFD